MRDSPSNFNKELVRFMKSAGFKQLECDKCVFFHLGEATKTFLLVGCEVDDLIIIQATILLVFFGLRRS